MGVTARHALTREQRIYIQRETTFGTVVQPTATGAIKALSIDLQPAEHELRERKDNRQTADVLELIRGRVKVKPFKIQTYGIGSGASGTPPDIHDLLLCHFGGYTNTPSTSDVYVHSDTQNARGSISVYREMSAVLAQAASGCWVPDMKCEIKGSEEPKWEFGLNGRDVYHTGYTTLNGGVSGGASSITVTDADQLENGSLVTIGTSTGAGAGHVLSGKSGATFTVSPTITGAQTNGADIIPHAPTETTAGSPIAGQLGSISLPSLSNVPVVSATLTSGLATKPHDNWAFSQYTQDYSMPADRQIQLELEIELRRDQSLLLGRYRNATVTVQAVTITVGSTAGNRFVWSIPRFVTRIPEINAGSEEIVMIKLSGIALGNTGGDAVTLSWT